MEINLRLLKLEDRNKYWEVGFKNPDKDMFYYTGTIHYPTKEEGIKREALYINNEFHNVYIMSILKKEFMEG